MADFPFVLSIEESPDSGEPQELGSGDYLDYAERADCRSPLERLIVVSLAFGDAPTPEYAGCTAAALIAAGRSLAERGILRAVAGVAT